MLKLRFKSYEYFYRNFKITYLSFSQNYRHKTLTHTTHELISSKLSSDHERTASGAHLRPIRTAILHHVVQLVRSYLPSYKNKIMLYYYKSEYA